MTGVLEAFVFVVAQVTTGFCYPSGSWTSCNACNPDVADVDTHEREHIEPCWCVSCLHIDRPETRAMSLSGLSVMRSTLMFAVG